MKYSMEKAGRDNGAKGITVMFRDHITHTHTHTHTHTLRERKGTIRIMGKDKSIH